jgi:quercetin dioxygenase-like cupin family protein
MKNIVTLRDLEKRVLNDGAGHVDGMFWEVFTKNTVGTEALRLLVQEYPPGGYTEGHPIHTDFEQCYYVLSGTMTVFLNGERHTAASGSFVFIPRGMKHEHRNDGDEPMVFLTINVPVRDGQPPPLPSS